MKIVGILVVVSGLLLPQGPQSHWISAEEIVPECESMYVEEGIGKTCKISINGPFSRSRSLNPGDGIYFYEGTQITDHRDFNPPGYKWKRREREYYYFVGRTGEKTFELRHTFHLSISREGGGSNASTDDSKPDVDEKYSYYFDAGAPVELRITPTFSKCLAGMSRIRVRLIRLKGSQLECQVLLPDCLGR